MRNLPLYFTCLMKGVLAAVLLMPALTWAHGAVDIPVSRQVYCYKQPDFWNNPKDKGCAAINAVSGSYPGQQWNEVAKLIRADEGYDYNNQADVETLIPDGKLCSANDPQKEGLNALSADWHRTDVTTANGKLYVRLIGTAPHVPSFVKIYLSKPGYDPSKAALKWSDVELVHSERLTVAKTNWGSTPPAITGATGFFEFNVAIPSNRTGDAVLFMRWQREDSAGEGFYNCSDITIEGPSIPIQLIDLGPFIDTVMNRLKPGDAVHFRILDNTPAAKEIVDITLPITASNLDPNIWGKQLADSIDPTIAKVGEKDGSTVVFNRTDYSANSVFALARGYSKAMAIIPGGGQTPVNPTAPIAHISGPTTVQSGQPFTFSARQSVGYNGPLSYVWVVIGANQPLNQVTVNGVAVAVTQPTVYVARLNVRDMQNGKTSQAELNFTVTPASDGGEYPAYKEGTAYKAGDIVTNVGKNYKCKPHPYTAWCAGAGWAYAPGSGTAWEQAWEEVK